MADITLKNGDCMSVLLNHGDNTVDLVVTDPPYGMSFMGKDWDRAIPDLKIFQELCRVLKPGAFCFVMCAPRSDLQWRMSQRLEEAGFRVDFTPIYFTFATGFPKAGNIGKLVDKKMGAEREVEIDKKWSGQNVSIFGGQSNRKISAPASPEAKALDGSYTGFNPKPAVEVIIVAMKKLSKKTYVEQALDNGKGVTWLDDCRIPYESEGDKGAPDRFDTAWSSKGSNKGWQREAHKNYTTVAVGSQGGRFSANLLVSDDVLGGSGAVSFSRFFSLDAWAGQVKQLPPEVQKTMPFMIVAKPSKAEKNKGCEGLEEKACESLRSNAGPALVGADYSKRTKLKNHHPTVKAVTLMRYLITLGSRKGDLVLDPFMGSGTTGVAAEMLGRKFVGIERNPEYFKIAESRISRSTEH